MKTIIAANLFAIATSVASVGLNLIPSAAFAHEGPGHDRAQRYEHGSAGRGGHMQEFGKHRLERMFRMVNATDEQKTKIRDIFAKARTDVAPNPKLHREQAMANHKKMSELLSAPSLDRAAIEKLRSERVQQRELVSKRMTTAMADAFEVLTPEQRAKVAEQMKRRMEHGRHHGEHGGHGGRGGRGQAG